MDKVKLTAIGRKIVLAYLTYVAISLMLIFPALNMALTSVYQQLTGRQLDYQLVGFNPFTLSLFAYGLRDTNPDGSTLWAMDRLVINPSLLQSLWHGAIGVDEIRLLGLTLKPEKLAEDRFNFSDIIEHSARNSAPEQTQNEASFTLPRVWVGEFELNAKLLQYCESHRQKPFNAGLKDFHFTLRDFSTLNEQGDGYHLRAESAQGGVLEWRGDISASGSKTWGQFSLTQFQLLPIWQFLEPKLNFTLNSGTFSIQGHYELDWKKALKWQISETQAALENVDLTQTSASTLAGQTPSNLGWQRFDADITQVNSRDKSASIKALNLHKLQLSSWHESARLGLADMFTITAATENKARSGNNLDEAQSTSETENTWQVFIDKSKVINASVNWLVPELDHRTINASPINLVIQNLSNSETEAQVNARLTLDNTAQLALEGSLLAITQSAHMNVRIEKLPLIWANPIIARQVNAELASGELNTTLQVTIENSEPSQIRAALSIDKFSAIDHKKATIASVEQLIIPTIDIDPRQRSLGIKNIDIKNLETEIAIAADGSTNLNHLIAGDSSQIEKAIEKPATAHPYQWQIDAVNVHNAAVKFTDETPLSTFSTRIQSFSGQVLNISSQSQQALSVDLKGQVDGYAPVTLAGNAKPFLTDPAMNLALNFTAIDLGLFNPYSTTFTGWKIEKGLLNVGLDYQLEDKRIVGNNRVTLDQLTLGERIDSRRLVDIPLRLALALLTDEHGVVDLQVPVTGTTDDPSFDIGAILWSAVRNSIMKVVTAPFNLLASLVDSEEDLGEIRFEPLQVLLTDTAKTRLADLKLALEQRPQLRLGITGEVNLAVESVPFKQQALNIKYREQGLSPADIDEQNTDWSRIAITLLAQQNTADLNKLSNELLQARLLTQQAQPIAELEQLANARSVAVKQYLLTQLNLDAQRVFIQSSTLQCKKKPNCTKARAKFSIE
ncbi:DUF748 domain-containing protein [Simiduia litorea]|uniref:DUF748 domain-containing protein n=1 Tax=Simiduia litorea TaxID=1435348 RepID=UPI0036F3D671